MDIDEFREWQDRLRMRSYEKLAAATGWPADQFGRWNRREEPIPYYVRLVFLALYHRLDDQRPGD